MRTWEDDESLSALMEETAKYRILGRKLESEYFERYHNETDPRQREKLLVAIIKSNLRFVLTMAKDYHRMTGIAINDFFAEGKLGLFEAFNKYDHNSGIKFISFAVWEIRRHMQLLVQNSDTVRVPVKIRKRVLETIKTGGNVASIQYGTLAANAIGDQTSIDEPAKKGDDMGNPMSVGDLLPAIEDPIDKNYSDECVRYAIDEAMSISLAPEESSLVKELYGLNGYEMDVSDVATRLSSTRERIRHIRNAAMAKLRNSSMLAELRDELKA